MPADAAAVARVHVRSWQAAYRGLLPDEYLDGLRPEDRMTHYTFGSPDRDLAHTSVAVEDGAIRGFVTTGPCEDDDAPLTGEVLALYADPSAWGLGAGRILIQEARRRLCDQGCADAVLWVLVGNRRAERFYQRDGWVEDGSHRQARVSGAAVDESRYRRRLP
jgi:GNAT superfamily N-acetyltransferase